MVIYNLKNIKSNYHIRFVKYIFYFNAFNHIFEKFSKMKLLNPLFISITAILMYASGIIAQDTISSPNPDGATKVYVAMYLNNISEINSASQIIKADMILSVSWQDPRLKHEGKGYIIAGLDKVWDPTITFTNRLNITKSFSEHVSIFGDGTVVSFQRIYGDFTQNLFYKDFPFDEQTLQLRLIDMSISYDSIEFEIDTAGSGVNKLISALDWKVEGWNLKKSDFTFEGSSEKVSSLVFEVKVKREYGYYVLLFIIPLLLIIMMSWMAFWLDSSLSSSQISIATTSMLTLIAYRFIVTANLPKIAYMTRMDLFIIGSSLLIFFTLLESIVTSSISARGNAVLAQKIDKHCRWIFPCLYVLVAVYAFLI